MICLLFSFAIGIGGGAFQIKGDNIVKPSYGPTAKIFFDFEFIPGLVYRINMEAGRANASTHSMVYESIQREDSTVRIPIYGVLGDKFEFIHGNLSLNWYPFTWQIKPYLSTRLGLMRWRFTQNGEVVMSLNGSNFDRYSIYLGGGAGVSTEFSNFIFTMGVTSDFIFSVDNNWDEGFGTEDENEYTIGFEISVAKEF